MHQSNMTGIYLITVSRVSRCRAEKCSYISQFCELKVGYDIYFGLVLHISKIKYH